MTYAPMPSLRDLARDWYPQDIVLAHQAAESLPGHFTLVQSFPLLIEYGRVGQQAEAFIWEYLGEFHDKPARIKASIPTAGLEFKCL